jgi:prepilin-type N-terminal cleavage/methylation domain-containing protein
MKIEKTSRTPHRNAFTLIEMIGVLAVIAILASLLIPKIFEAINNARINNAVVSYNTVKTACMDHYAKYGAINQTTNGAAASAANLAAYDKLLLSEGFLDKPYASALKVGTGATVEAVAGAGSGFPGNFDLDGNGTSDTSSASYVVEVVITNVAFLDAQAISDRLDGTLAPLAMITNGTKTTGRVQWNGGTSNVYIYVTHR